MSGPGTLIVRGLTKRFGQLTALTVTSLEIGSGEFFTVVGPSGCGKSTLLSIISGAMAPSEGQVLLDGRDIVPLPPERRPTVMVFQSLALFPHMSVGQNIEFAMRVRGEPADQRRAKAFGLLDQIRLPRDYYRKAVHHCSGGERQRVAIARALAYEPDVLLFDEPLSALDYRLRKTLEVELKSIHKDTGKTFVYVTHSLEEAMVMSDRIAIMRNGRIVQIDTPENIYLYPANRFVADFLGETNIFPVRRSAATDPFEIVTRDGTKGAPVLPPCNAGTALEGYVIVRPECLRFVNGTAPGDEDVALPVDVRTEYLLGARVRYVADYCGIPVIIERMREEAGQTPARGRAKVAWPYEVALFAVD